MQSIIVKDFSLECRFLGPPPEEAPTLVLLHEGLGSAGLWRDFPEKMQAATGLGVFVYSRAGYGGSDPDPLPWPLEYMERHAREVLPGVLDAIGFRRGLLVGHSDGASIAALYAGTVSDPRVQGCALMAPHFFIEKICLEAIAGQDWEFGGDKSRPPEPKAARREILLNCKASRTAVPHDDHAAHHAVIVERTIVGLTGTVLMKQSVRAVSPGETFMGKVHSRRHRKPRYGEREGQ